jgi:hypothetical protein
MSDMPNSATDSTAEKPMRLRDALRQARIEAADRTGVVVEQIPARVDLFDRGISQGENPRLWIDVVAHIAMGRDKRIYRFVQDTRFGRIVIAESHEVPAIIDAVTDYVARRMVEREHALVATPIPEAERIEKKRRSGFWTFAFGFILGALALFGLALFATLRNM